MVSNVRLAGLVVALLLVPGLAQAQERFAVGGNHVAVYNLAGDVQVRGTTGGQVTVEVRRGGRDAAELRVEVGAVGGRQALRVLYPSDRVIYGARGWSGTTQLRVADDGTWGDGRVPLFGRRGSVRISAQGSGLEAHADLEIAVPRGQRVDIYLGAGTITAENVDGRVRLDTHGGAVTARDMAGELTIDTGAGRVEVAGMRGDLRIDTGSGGVRVADVAGDRVVIDTGSGRVEADRVSADRLVIDTGSGSIDLRGGSGRAILLDTGSGSVRAELAGAIDDLVVDTGSGSVTLGLPRDLDARFVIDTGRGRIDLDFPLRVTRQDRNTLHGVAGEGRGSVRIDTGSGGVRLTSL